MKDIRTLYTSLRHRTVLLAYVSSGQSTSGVTAASKYVQY